MNALRTLTRLTNAIAKAYRRQIAKEDHRWLLAQFALLDRQLGLSHAAGLGIRSPRRPQRVDDPLERLWQLPACLHPLGANA
ncbi:MAG: hypothetical protein FWD04_04275 [Conexibacteraceae bacterium]|nr:hypothetical protein [Conexibacteraceae bacterium]